MIELVEINTRSQNGSATTYSTPPNVIRKKPVIHWHLQNTGLLLVEVLT